MGWLGRFASGVRNLGSKALGVVQAVGHKVSDVAGTIGNVASSIAPALSTLPVVGEALSKAAGSVGSFAHKVGGYAGVASAVAGGLKSKVDDPTLGQVPPMG